MEWEKLMCPERLRVSSTGDPLDRSNYQRDYDRIIFSKPFRRLQKKTQVFPLPEHDFIHTRLTHSLETSCVGRSLGMAAAKAIFRKFPSLKDANISEYDFASVVAAASVAHDIGNPPFGHSGEDAFCDYFTSPNGMQLIENLSKLQQLDFQKFEGNAMGFRLMAYTLPGISSNPGGLNLTYATLGAFSKYPCEVMEPKIEGVSSKKHGFFQGQKEIFVQVADKLGLKKKHNSFGVTTYYRHPLAFLVEAADDISYLLMDFEDGYNLKIISHSEIENAFRALLTKECPNSVLDKTYDKREKVAYLRAIAITNLIEQVIEVFTGNLDKIMEGEYDKPLAKEITKSKELNNLDSLCKQNVYNYRKVLEIESAGFDIIGGLLDEFINSLRRNSKKAQKVKSLLAPHYILEKMDTPDQWYEAVMHIVQFVAGMTDTFAIDTYRTIKGIRLPSY
jgi:dGTPase